MIPIKPIVAGVFVVLIAADCELRWALFYSVIAWMGLSAFVGFDNWFQSDEDRTS